MRAGRAGRCGAWLQLHSPRMTNCTGESAAGSPASAAMARCAACSSSSASSSWRSTSAARTAWQGSGSQGGGGGWGVWVAGVGATPPGVSVSHALAWAWAWLRWAWLSCGWPHPQMILACSCTARQTEAARAEHMRRIPQSGCTTQGPPRLTIQGSVVLARLRMLLRLACTCDSTHASQRSFAWPRAHRDVILMGPQPVVLCSVS